MILNTIIESVRNRIAEQKANCPLEWIKQQMFFQYDDRNLFKKAIRRPGIQIIAEIKRASPSAGIICSKFNPVAIAMEYASANVAAISVLTEEKFFQGSLNNLQVVRQNVSTPILRKDFIIDSYQLYQSKLFGVNCVLLITSILSERELTTFLRLAKELKMNTLVEIHDEFELDKALKVDAEIIGINNRDLKTFTVDLNTSFRLREKIPADKIVISESGIKNRMQVIELEEAGIDAILIGETLMRSNDIKKEIRNLLGFNTHKSE
ncbi:MAG: indole-3-glycerol phosphate synthase TrpC [bacterium]|nr:MAG: indole-3-glycerol phosphate synthase TrpC [bacterium]